MEIPEQIKKKLTLPAEEHFYAGHTACQGCGGAALGLRYVLKPTAGRRYSQSQPAVRRL